MRWLVFAACLSAASAWSVGPTRATAQPNEAAPGVSLASLLAGRAAPSDPVLADLLQLHAELSARAEAQAAAAALALAAEAIEAAHRAELEHATATSTRKKQIAWAALSLADRLIARASAEAALREAERRARGTQAAL